MGGEYQRLSISASHRWRSCTCQCTLRRSVLSVSCLETSAQVSAARFGFNSFMLCPTPHESAHSAGGGDGPFSSVTPTGGSRMNAFLGYFAPVHAISGRIRKDLCADARCLTEKKK